MILPALTIGIDMSEEQIRMLYREAADKEKQVVILCQLTDRPKKEICGILGIPFNDKKSGYGWTEEQLEFLKANIGKMTDAEIGKNISKSTGAVKNMRHKIGGKAPVYPSARWSEEETDFLRKAYKNGVSSRRIGQLLGKSKRAIESKIHELKVKGELYD